ncbi:MAG: ImmA/IrrE family metallo-endopeptidase [Bacteroidetes bacterium]|nr:ImmA/IrrE family metallo-endopeptidase [Bacteroidota bacterium]MBS1740246.1 ImmA/IrrE family metallo-endopeptidase [Bacteroidota bacterium]
MENVFGNRLVSARKMAGMSLQNLADRLNNVVSKQSLNKYEQGKMKPDSELLIALSNVLRVPVDYFFSSPNFSVQLNNISYRKFNSKISKGEQIAIEEKSKEAFERYFELENVLNIEDKKEYFVYDKVVSNAIEAEDAAKELRKKWKLGYDPIPDVVEMLEDKGYKIVEIEAPEGFDGLKAEIEEVKIIVLKQNKNENEDVVRKRFTALHELAHHALKFPKNISEREEENLCHAFASAVLYPEDMVRKELHKDRFHFYQNELVLIKERWGISFPAIFNRAKQLGIINDYVFKKFNIGYRERKLHLNEPGRFLSKEKPVRFERLIYLGLSKEVISVNDAAFFSGKTVGEFRKQLQQIV